MPVWSRTSLARRVVGADHVIDVSQEFVDIVVDSDLSSRDELVDLALPLLPALSPEPRLIGRHRKCRPQLQDTVLAFSDLQLGAGLIQVHTLPDVRRECNDAAALKAEIAV